MMQTSIIEKPKEYEKHQSFQGFQAKSNDQDIEAQRLRSLKILETNDKSSVPMYMSAILARVKDDLSKINDEHVAFKITSFITDEMQLLDDSEVIKFLYHRYRYDVFPKTKELDKFPPYIQIEPTSICNFRCVFCYQTDHDFSDKSSGFMGSMKLDTYKSIIDQIEGNIEFLSLSSRGEPTANKYLPEMLEYSRGKFLNLKINTNASLLTDKIIHALLNGSVRTLVFSADAAVEPLYSQLRVNGHLDKVLKNIEKLQNIREKEYPDLKILTRVSGVMVDDERQSIETMQDLWTGLVDQITFVKYNPWENVYESPVNELSKPCSDLWRRMFVWYDGIANPCDTDYKSSLKMGNVADTLVSDLWLSDHYNNTRSAHLMELRHTSEPCSRCSLV